MQAIAAQLNETRAALGPLAGATAALEARLLAAHAWGMTVEGLVRYSEEARDPAVLGALLQRRLAHEPISHIMGVKEFWRDRFEVTPDVLTPRADSETMIESLLRHRPEREAALRLLDLGTGSGCLLLSALREYPRATGVGADRSEAALAVAKRNAKRLDFAERSRFCCSNWCSKIEGSFDIILANPPYIPTGVIAALDADVRDYEPHLALDGGIDGLDCYREILAQVLPHLASRGLVFFEVGTGQAAEVAALGLLQGLTLIEISADLAGIARVVVLQTE